MSERTASAVRGLMLVVAVAGSTLLPAQVGSPASAAPRVVAFVESSQALGVAEATETWGIAVTDWDGDNCDDLYVGRHNRKYPRLYRNGCPGVFTDEVARLRLDSLPWFTTRDRHTPAFADFNGDGRMDLFIPTGGGAGHGRGNDDQLFRQPRDGMFINIAPSRGMIDTAGSGRFGAWFDYDQDKDLDLFLGHFVQSERPEDNRNILWQNLDGSFADAAPAAGIDTLESSTAGLAADLDGDGKMDMLTVPGQRVSVYYNRGDGTFEKRSLNVQQVISASAGDYDGDGDLDLFLSLGHTGRNEQRPLKAVLLRNDLTGWTDVTAEAGVGDIFHCLSAVWIDADNDGRLDLFVNRHADATGKNLPDLLLMNNGDGTFRDAATEAGVTGPADGNKDAGAWGDFNGDGFVDLAVASSMSATSVLIYLNQGNANHWITVRLRDRVGSNNQAIGAQIQVFAGGRTQYRQITSGTARWAQSVPYAQFGLGETAVVDTLVIRWPDGMSSTFTNVPADQHYIVRRTQLQTLP